MATPLDIDITNSYQGKPKRWAKVTSTTSTAVKMAKKTLTAVLRRAWKKQRELRILVTGKTGQGKSTLINGILGSKVAIEGAGATRCTTEVTVYSKTIEGVPIKVFDSPGLQDRTDNEEEYIRGMREKCQELSLILYCTKMGNTRLTDDDKNAMIKLTEAFGEKFWEFTVFVLTFANKEDVERKDDRDEDDGPEPDDDDEKGWKELMKRRFEGRLRHWKEGLHQFLIKEVGVSHDIVINIPIVPTGDSKMTRTNKYPLRLPDRENWFTSYWETCCLRVKETRLFLKINSGRIFSDDCQGADDKPDEEDSEDEDVYIEDDKNDDIDLSPLESFNARRSVFEPQPELILPVERKIPKLAQPNKPHKELQDTLQSPRTIKSPPPPPPPKPPKKTNLGKWYLHQSQQAHSMVVSETHLQEDYSSLEDPTSHVSRFPTPQAHKELQDHSIHLHPTLVRGVTAVTMRRAGFHEKIIKKAETLIDHMKKPNKWFMSTFKRIKKEETRIDANDIG